MAWNVLVNYRITHFNEFDLYFIYIYIYIFFFFKNLFFLFYFYAWPRLILQFRINHNTFSIKIRIFLFHSLRTYVMLYIIRKVDHSTYKDLFDHVRSDQACNN